MRIKSPVLWVVYRTPPSKGSAEGANAVCEQSEWDAMEAARPGSCTLVRGHMTNEGEAERLARGASGDRGRVGQSHPSLRAIAPQVRGRR